MAPASEESSGEPEVALLFIGVSLVLGGLCKQVLKRTPVPYTVALLLVGVALGVLDHYLTDHLGYLGVTISRWSNINPNLILFVFLPALLFESSFSFDVHQTKRCILQMVLLAGPGVAISTALLGIASKFILPYQWSWSESLLLGGLLSATDPVAVVALLKELGVSKKLSTIIEGESLMNDGTAIVVFKLFLTMALGEVLSPGQIVAFLFQVVFGAVALGLAFAIVSILWLGTVFNDRVIEISITLITSYMAFFVAESSAHVSGVLTVMTIGICYAAFARTAFTGSSEESMQFFWEMITHIANTVIFILSGVVIAEKILDSTGIEGRDWGYMLLLYLLVQLSRVVVVAACYPGLRFSGYGIDLKECGVLVWAGLRGAVALSLALQVGKEDKLAEPVRARFIFHTGGVVFLTLVINGSTTQYLIRILGLNKISDVKYRVIQYVWREMHDRAVQAYEEVGEDDDLGPADLDTVQKYVPWLQKDKHPLRPQSLLIDTHLQSNRTQKLLDTRIRFLNGVQAQYWYMLEKQRITQNAARLLMQSVDVALDVAVKQNKLDDWSELRPHLIRLKKLKKLQSLRILPQKTVQALVVAILGLSCSLGAAFVRAHRRVRQQLIQFLGESEAADVLRESEEEEEEAKRFLEEVNEVFPEVLRTVKTRQVAHSVLIDLLEYVEDLEHSGLLDRKETLHLHDDIEREMKLLLRKPPIIRMRMPLEVLSQHSFMPALATALPPDEFSAAREMKLLHGQALFKAGTAPSQIFLIATGVVKVDYAGYKAFFSSGSVLGLYEVITQRPRLATAVADSAVQCFTIERATLLSLLRKERTVVDHFWEQSTSALAKMLLPELFEDRSWVDIVSEIKLYGTMLTGQAPDTAVELQRGEKGLLLEGCLLLTTTTADNGETAASVKILEAPAAIRGPEDDGLPKDVRPAGQAGMPPALVLRLRVRGPDSARVLVLRVPLASDNSIAGAKLAHTHSSRDLLPPGRLRDHSGLFRWPRGGRQEHGSRDGLEEESDALEEPLTRRQSTGTLGANSTLGAALSKHLQKHLLRGRGIGDTDALEGGHGLATRDQPQGSTAAEEPKRTATEEVLPSGSTLVGIQSRSLPNVLVQRVPHSMRRTVTVQEDHLENQPLVPREPSASRDSFESHFEDEGEVVETIVEVNNLFRGGAI